MGILGRSRVISVEYTLLCLLRKHFKNHDNFVMLMYVVGAQQLLSNHCISDILWSLCDMAVEAGQQLRKDTSSIDLQRDTQQLKCVFVVCIFPAIFYVCVSVHVSFML